VRVVSRFAGAAVVVAGLVLSVLPATAGAAAVPEVAPTEVVAAAAATCSEQVDAAVCDSDRDGITDVVEQVVCGSATCATGR